MIDFAGVGIQLESVVDLLKREMTFHTICRQLIYQRIIRASAKERNIEVTDDEIQAEADRVRRELRLENAQKTLEWLQERMITADEWEASIRDRLLSQKLADAMFGETATHQFNQQKLDYEKVSLYKIVILDSKLAQELTYQIEEEEISFFEAAHRYDDDPIRRRCCGYEGEISRWALPPDIAAVVFCAPAQTIVGPISLGRGYGLFFADEFIEPKLTEETYRAICDRLFYQWLDSELQRLET
jgi:parvulin-like peptidyl-prolyl isomerase